MNRKNEDKYRIFAFDIERSGHGDDNQILAIGYCVTDDSDKIIARERFNMYMPEFTIFSKECYDEFWKDKQHILKYLKVTKGEYNSIKDCEIHNLNLFFSAIKKHEEEAKKTQSVNSG